MTLRNPRLMWILLALNIVLLAFALGQLVEQYALDPLLDRLAGSLRECRQQSGHRAETAAPTVWQTSRFPAYELDRYGCEPKAGLVPVSDGYGWRWGLPGGEMPSPGKCFDGPATPDAAVTP